MKSVLISIQPKWCELIASGKKTVEVRKTRPKIDTPFKCYIYCTKSTDRLLYFSCNDKVLRTTKSKYIHSIERTCKIFSGKVIGEFLCDSIVQIAYKKDGYGLDDSAINGVVAKSCVQEKELYHYLQGKPPYLWHISDLKIYDKPKELSEFYKPCVNPGSKICELCELADFENNDAFVQIPKCINTLTRPPQSWCYVEECSV